MRIMMMTHSYPPIAGGIELHVKNLSKKLVSRGHKVIVFTLWHDGMQEYELEHGVKVYRVTGSVHRLAKSLFIHPGRRYAPPVPDPEITAKLQNIIVKERPQIIHGHNWLLRSFLPLKNWSKAKLVVTLHDYGHICAKWNLMYRGEICDGPGLVKCIDCSINNYGLLKGLPIVLSNWGMKEIEKRAVDMYLPVSQSVAIGNDLINSGVPYQIIPSFLPDDIQKIGISSDNKYASLLAKLPDDDYLLYVGAFSYQKGIDTLLQAYASLIDAPPLVLIGYEVSDYKPNLDGMKNNVKILKNWPHEAVMSAWRKSKIAIVPSIWPEPNPAVAVEAMAVGLPVIASRIGGLPDLVIDNVTGILVQPGNPKELCRAIQHLLSNDAFRENLGQAGKKKSEEFLAKVIVPKIENLYAEIIG